MKIYIAGPYGDSNPKDIIAENVARADAIGRAIVKLGHTPYIPHKQTWHWEDDPELNSDDFMRVDLEWLRVCDALFFIAPSDGALCELQLALELGKQIFYSIDDIQKQPMYIT